MWFGMEIVKLSFCFEIDLISILCIYIYIFIYIDIYILYLYKIIFLQVDFFVLLYNYDEIIGYLMWYVCIELCQDWFFIVFFKIYIMYMLYIYVKNVRIFVGF